MRLPPKDTMPAPDSDPLGSGLARSVFDAAPVGLLVLAPDGTVIAANAAFGAPYGLDPQGYVGGHYSGFANRLEIRRLDSKAEEASWISARALRGERVEAVFLTVRDRANGREFVVRCGASPVFEGGRFVATTVTLEDATAATRARQSVQAALSVAEVGTYWIDLRQRAVWGDENFARIYDLAEEDVRGGPFAKLYERVHPDDLARATGEIERAAKTGGAYEVEYRVVTSTGDVRWLLSRGRFEAGPDGGARQRLGSVVDVTRRRRIEDALREANRRLETLAATDPLTGLWNLRAFRERLVEESSEAGRLDRELALVLFDVDRFKSYNDAFGHPAGDDALKIVAGALQEETRTYDVAARSGGEEFALLLPTTGEGEAVRVAERVRAALEARLWPHRTVTVSAGVAATPRDARTPDGLVEAADRALYAAKEGGRNRVVTAAGL